MCYVNALCRLGLVLDVMSLDIAVSPTRRGWTLQANLMQLTEDILSPKLQKPPACTRPDQAPRVSLG